MSGFRTVPDVTNSIGFCRAAEPRLRVAWQGGSEIGADAPSSLDAHAVARSLIAHRRFGWAVGARSGETWVVAEGFNESLPGAIDSRGRKRLTLQCNPLAGRPPRPAPVHDRKPFGSAVNPILRPPRGGVVLALSPIHVGARTERGVESEHWARPGFGHNRPCGVVADSSGSTPPQARFRNRNGRSTNSSEVESQQNWCRLPVTTL